MADKSINELVALAHGNAVEKGFYDNCLGEDGKIDPSKINVAERLELMHEELSEAFREYRNHHGVDEVYHFRHEGEPTTFMVPGYGSNTDKPEGFPVELADVLIRICDFAGAFGINLGEAVEKKMAYNATRSYRHGGKRA